MSINALPHDRIVFFSDAIFAIAITLLVMEIKVPDIQVVRTQGMISALASMLPLFIGFFVSFLVTSLFWKAHLQLCRMFSVFDHKLLWINTVMLMFVVMMPFSTALYSRNFSDNVAFSFYCLNLAAIGIFNFWLANTVISRMAAEEGGVTKAVRWIKWRALIVPCVFLLCILLSTFSPLLSRVAFVLIFIAQAVGDRLSKRKVIVAQLDEIR